MAGAIGYGTTLTIGGAAVTQVVDVKGPGLDVPAADVTHNSSASGCREKIPKLIEPGQITFNCVKTTTNTAQLIALIRTVSTVVITYPDTHTWTCAGWLAGIDAGDPLDDTQTLDLKWQCSGLPVYA